MLMEYILKKNELHISYTTNTDIMLLHETKLTSQKLFNIKKNSK